MYVGRTFILHGMTTALVYNTVLQYATRDRWLIVMMTYWLFIKFNTHVANIYRKAERKMHVLARIYIVLNMEGKVLLFNSFILSLSHYEYCATILALGQ